MALNAVQYVIRQNYLKISEIFFIIRFKYVKTPEKGVERLKISKKKLQKFEGRHVIGRLDDLGRTGREPVGQ